MAIGQRVFKSEEIFDNEIAWEPECLKDDGAEFLMRWFVPRCRAKKARVQLQSFMQDIGFHEIIGDKEVPDAEEDIYTIKEPGATQAQPASYDGVRIRSARAKPRRDAAEEDREELRPKYIWIFVLWQNSRFTPWTE